MRFTLLVLLSALCSLALSGSNAVAATAAGWEHYANSSSVIRGSFTIEDGRVTGTLPPGSTTDQLSVADPELRAAFSSATNRVAASTLPAALPDLPAGAVIEADRIAVPLAWAYPQKLSNASEPSSANVSPQGRQEGCVTAISNITGGGLSFRGVMAGCRRARHSIRAWLEADGRRVMYPDAVPCGRGTECRTPTYKYGSPPRCREFVNYARGRNDDTGAFDTAYEVHRPLRPGC